MGFKYALRLHYKNKTNKYIKICQFIKIKVKGKSGLEWPKGFQKVKVPRFHDNGTGWW